MLLLEAGNPDTKPEIFIPAQCVNLLGLEVDWSYFSEPEPFLNNRKIFCSRGKVLGGSSSINFMMYVRGNHHDYDHWQELGNPGWNYQHVLPRVMKHSLLISATIATQCGIPLALAKWALTQWQWSILSCGYMGLRDCELLMPPSCQQSPQEIRMHRPS